MSEEIEWFVCRGEGYVIEPVALSTLKRDGWRYPIFGAQKGEKRVFYDRILAKHGLGPFRIVWRDRLEMELREG
jgi:hypothetical protein